MQNAARISEQAPTPACAARAMASIRNATSPASHVNRTPLPMRRRPDAIADEDAADGMMGGAATPGRFKAATFTSPPRATNGGAAGGAVAGLNRRRLRAAPDGLQGEAISTASEAPATIPIVNGIFAPNNSPTTSARTAAGTRLYRLMR